MLTVSYCYEGMVEDITERKQVEEALAKQRLALRRRWLTLSSTETTTRDTRTAGKSLGVSRTSMEMPRVVC